MSNFTVGSTYSFRCYAPSILSSDFSNVVVTMIMGYQAAIKEDDVAAIHAQIYNQLPTGTPNQPEKYTYIQIQHPSGQTEILGIPWINALTITEVDQVTFDVTIRGLSSTDYTKISNALKQNGISDFTIKIL